MTGVYKIQSNCKPERIYIGSAINIYKRWNTHRRELRLGSHHSIKLQRHYDKYGLLDLKFEILLCCSTEDLIKHEQFYLDLHETYFNNCKIAGNSKGCKLSDKTRELMRKNHKGMRGRHHSEESRKRISDAKKGKSIKGHIVTEETRKKMRLAKLGKKRIKVLLNIN